MRRTICLLPLLCLSVRTPAAPLEETIKPAGPERLYQGDMHVKYSRNGLRDAKFHWPNATVYFKISTTFSEPQVNQINLAMQMIQNVSCVRFVPADEEVKGYVFVNDSDTGCWSQIGYYGQEQIVNLHTGCLSLGIIQHELLHTLGFLHQQNSADRDDYINIDWTNIKEKHKKNFIKANSSLVWNFGSKYDYNSIMHYSGTAFRINSSRPTIETLQNLNGRRIGQRERMSDTDISRLNNMYKCDLATSAENWESNENS